MPDSFISVPLTAKMKPNRVVLFVHWDMQSGSVDYRLASVDGETDLIYTPVYSSPLSVTQKMLPELQNQMQKAFLEVSELIDIGTNLETCRLALAKYSESLTATLIPEELISILNAHEDIWTIQISSDEYWIPWDILWSEAKATFWGCCWDCVRLPVTPSGCKKKPVPFQNQSDLRSVLHIIGPEVSSNTNDVINTVDMFGWIDVQTSTSVVKNNPVSDDYTRIEDLGKKCSSEGYDIAHFICHCRNSELSGPFLELGRGAEYWLHSGNIDRVPLKNAIVLSSACSVAKPVNHLHQVIVFGWEFNQAGAGAFIGPIADVTFDVGVSFGAQFFRKVIDENLSVVCAFREVREHFMIKGDLRVLFYTLCGYPDARKTVSQSL